MLILKYLERRENLPHLKNNYPYCFYVFLMYLILDVLLRKKNTCK